MPTLNDLYLNYDSKTVTKTVRINGVLIVDVLAVEWSFAYGQVPTATITIPNPAPAAVTFFAPATIDIGFNGVVQRVFTGQVLNVNPGEQETEIECQGMSSPLENTFHEEILITIDGVKNAEELCEDSCAAAGLAAYHVTLPHWHPGTQILDPDPDHEPYTILKFQTYGDAINKIAEVDGGRWYETPTGTTRVEVREPVPSLNAWRTYFSMQLTGFAEGETGIATATGAATLTDNTKAWIPNAYVGLTVVSSGRSMTITSNTPTVLTGAAWAPVGAPTVGPYTIYTGYPAGVVFPARPRIDNLRVQQDVKAVKNKAIVEGCTYVDAAGENILIHSTASAPSPWVLNPNGTQAYNAELFTNELIDTIAKAGEVAGRIVALKNRMITSITLPIHGDPQVNLGVTVRVIDLDYTGIDARWFVESYTSRLDSSGFTTTLTLLGGTEAGGTINVFPFALFTYAVDYEVIGDRNWAIVTFDASGSIDPDGTIADPAGYVWTAAAPNAGVIAGTGKIRTVAVDPAAYTPPLKVTLTVTDNEGATDAMELEIDITAGAAAVVIPALFTANDKWFSATPDGGINWNDQAYVAGGVISVSAKPEDYANYGIAVYGTYTGGLWRTTDYCATALTQVMADYGHPITHVWWDRNLPTRVWACSQNGMIFRSDNDGLTWYAWDDLAARFGLGNIRLQRLSTPSPKGLWAFGGTGTGYPLIVWDADLNHNWSHANLGGGLLVNLDAAGLPVDVYVADAACGEYNALAIILNSATITTAVYYTDDIFGDGSRWGWATACSVNSLGAWIQPDHIPGQYCFGYTNNNLVYRGDVTAGVMAVTLAPGSLAADHGQNHGWWMGAWLGAYSGVYLVSAMDISGTILPGFVYKTFDRFETNPVGLLRPSTVYPLDTYGTSTAVAATSLTDTLKTWAVNRYAGMIVSAGGRTGVIVSNTATKLTIVDWLGGADPVSPVAYAISLANARAFMTVPGASGTALTEARVLLAGKLTDPKRFAAWRTGLGNWTSHTFADEFTNCDILQPRALTSTLWFILGFDGQDSANDTDNRIMRTQDAGVNWAAFTQPKAGNDYWQDFALDAGGRFWGLTLDVTDNTPYGTTKAWYSTDEGDTWTLSEEWIGSVGAGSRLFYRIVCHPTNQNIIAVVGTALHGGIWAGEIRTAYTLDRGASWGLNLCPDHYYQTMPVANDVIMTASGRLVFVAGSWIKVLTSDDYGANWTIRLSFGSYLLHRLLGPVSNLLGSRIYVLHIDFSGSPNVNEVWYSDDQGLTWTQFDNDVTTRSSDRCYGGIAYEESLDALYVPGIGATGTYTTNEWLVDKMSPPEKAGTWLDFSDTLVPIGAETHFHIPLMAQQIVAIPR